MNPDEQRSRSAGRRSGPRPWPRWAAAVLVGVAVWCLWAAAAGAQEAAEEGERPAVEEGDRPVAVEGVQVNGLGRLRLNFQDAPLDTVLSHLSDVAGLVVIRDAAIDGRITVMSRQPLEVPEAVEVLNSVLKEKGYAAVRTGRTLKIIALAEAKKANIPVRFGADPEAIPATDEVVTQVIPISHVDAVRLREDLAPLMSDYADAAANANSNTLILTDTSANIRRIVQVVAGLDRATASVIDVRVFPLQYADAVEAARLVNQIFGEEGTAGRAGRGGIGGDIRARIRRFTRGGGGEDDSPPGQGVSVLDVRVSASADQRTNTVVVGGPPQTLDAVAQVLEELDANPVAVQGVFVYPVRNGQAANMQQVLNRLFGVGGTAAGRGGAGRQTLDGSFYGNRPRGSRGDRAGFLSGAPGTPGSPGGAGGSGRGDIPGGPSALEARLAGLSPEAAETATDLYGQVYIEADEDTNSLLVMTSPKHFDQVRRIIEELDRPVPQVLIKVLIAEVTHDDALDLGVEFSVLNIDSGDFELFTEFGVESAVQAGAEGVVFRVLKSDLQATLRALQEVGKLEVLSRPYILTSDNQPATITVGSEVPFIINTRVTETGQTINTIQYDDVGIILNVTPHINPDGLVVMDVAPEISAIGGQTVPISETVDAPVIEKRSSQNRVSIQDGHTIVIGGLMEDQQTQSVSKVPLLGDLPLVGALFQRQVYEKNKTELLIFLTPHVAADAGRMKQISDDERSGMKIVPDAVAPGTFEEHMEGMRRGAKGDYPMEEEEEDDGRPAEAPAEPPGER